VTNTERTSISVIDEYIRTCPESIRATLQLLKNIISQEAPGAIEKISYGMPTFYLKENLVHFAVAKRHIGFYPTPSGVTAFESELGAYKHSKGAIQFPLDKPLPEDLIRRIVGFRVREVVEKHLQGRE
jgi:uncharacterized protein YdhG (YjbR/CyaY superfamily)